MNQSIERVRAVISGQMPDRTPLFDLLRNSAVIRHFTGVELTVENGAELVYKAYAPAIDATRPTVKHPAREETVTLPDGRRQHVRRWTAWTERRHYADSAAYACDVRRRLAAFDPTWTAAGHSALDATLAAFAADRRRLGEVFYVPDIPGPFLMGLYGEVGLEHFSYYLADCPDAITGLLEMHTAYAESWYHHLPANHGIEAGFLGDDIAFKSGPLFSPAWMRKHYFPRLGRAVAAAHARGIKVLFHSDGNLNPILDDLVAAGIDGLNPIEVLAGMDVGDIHRRHLRLFLAGGIDVSQLLPFGTEVAQEIAAAFKGGKGVIMKGAYAAGQVRRPAAAGLAG